MILYPAIDLKDGQCVRLLKGDMNAVTVFNDDPAAQARTFAEAGAEWLHLVDLNGAVKGAPVNAEAVEAIRAAVELPIQLGGGIRDIPTIEMWLEKGIDRVILGTVAVRDPMLVKSAARRFPGKIAVGIDARGGMVAVEGWAKTTDLPALDIAFRYEDAGIAAIVYTDIDRDGAMKGPNVKATTTMAKAVDIPVLASGGVSSLEDIEALMEEEEIAGAVTGRAIYDGRLDLAEAVRLTKG